MSASYLDIDSILSENEKVAVEIKDGATRLGFLDRRGVHLRPRAKVDLPVWLVHSLLEKGFHASLTIKLPLFLRSGTRTHMEAHAQGLDLNTASPYYFELSKICGELIPNEEENLRTTSGKVLGERLLSMLDHIETSEQKDVSEFVDKLTVREAKLYQEVNEHAKAIAAWKRSDGGRADSNKRARSMLNSAE